MTDNFAKNLNERLNPLGYEADQSGDFYFIGFIDPPKRTRLFQTRADAEAVATSIEKSQWWRLDLRGGSVNFDRNKLWVTPIEGDNRPAFHVNDTRGSSGDGPSTDGSDAHHLYYESSDHPPLCGRWHKWGSLF
ncbi:MAG: hypothetical protein PGN30_09845 [Mycolicibacterium neoaurum]|uniref:hypothetical protein n=1 Tax=Mycolicibacterium neoaurum TaxID=1795 RepID=UPI002FF865DA